MTLESVIIALAAVNSTATPQDSSQTEIIFLVAAVIAIAAILYTYRLTQTKDGLEAKARNLKRLIEKQREEIKENEEKIAVQREELSKKVDPWVKDEAIKAGKMAGTKKQTAETLRMEYWNRIERLGDSGTGEVEKLEAEKNEIESVIDLTKTKYHTRVIDEKTFGEIVGEYEKKLIELESKLNKLKRGK